MGTMCTVNNKLIAEFMGAKMIVENHHGINIIEFEDKKQFDLLGLKYHSSWDWLMPVVEKIESLGVNFWTVKNKVKLTIVGELARKLNDSLYDTEFEGYDFEYYIEDTKIEAVYQAVVEFIKWYKK